MCFAAAQISGRHHRAARYRKLRVDLPLVGRSLTTGICRWANPACLGPGPGRQDLGPRKNGANLTFAGFRGAVGSLRVWDGANLTFAGLKGAVGSLGLGAM